MNPTPVFYSRTKGSVVDLALTICGEDSVINTIGFYGRQSIDSLREQFPDIEVLPFETAFELQSAVEYDRYKGVYEIDRTAYINALEMLPPLKWSLGDEAESFRCQEATTGLLHASYVALAAGTSTRYFSLVEPITAKHEELVQKVNEALASGAVKSCT